MKIKRFVAKSMREAIRMVREEQGPDAVILSNRRVANGVEVVAATDYDAALMQQAVRIAEQQFPVPSSQFSEQRQAPAPAPVTARAPAQPPQRRSTATRAAPPSQPPPAGGGRGTMSGAAAAPRVLEAGNRKPETPTAPAPEIKRIEKELGGVRKLLEEQLAGLVWRDMSERSPERMAAVRAMASLALDPQLTREIIAELPDKPTAERARFLPLGLLSRRIPVVKDDLVLGGGVFALVGPTGVGKTTTVAKLAARYADKHGLRDIALVTTDTFRVGAQEQLFTYGRLLGVPVHSCANADELAKTLARLADRKLVLIDTAGMAPRDQKLAAQLTTLTGTKTPVRCLLVLSATTQAGDLDEVMQRFAPAKPESCVLTKLDEATRIGGVLSGVIRRQLPIAYLTDGQRVPEDIGTARADQLVLRAMQLARQSPAVPDDTTLALQFGAAHVSV